MPPIAPNIHSAPCFFCASAVLLPAASIRRVIFTTLNKRNRGGQGTVKVPVSLIKQIGGRAGRRNR